MKHLELRRVHASLLLLGYIVIQTNGEADSLEAVLHLSAFADRYGLYNALGTNLRAIIGGIKYFWSMIHSISDSVVDRKLQRDP